MASKNINTIVAFVRDRIWSCLLDGRRQSRDGAAMGQHRDPARRIRLVARSCRPAGHAVDRGRLTATVRPAQLPTQIDLPTLYRVRAAEFAPDTSLLAAAAKVTPPPSMPSSPPSTSNPAATAASAIAAALPAALQRAKARPDLLPSMVPVVEVVQAGTSLYAYALGNLAPTTTAPAGLDAAVDADATPSVSVSVTGIASPAPGSTTPRASAINLVSGNWPAEDVFGRQILLNFVPPDGATGLLDNGTAGPVRPDPFLRVQTELPAYAAPAIPKPKTGSSPAPTPPSGVALYAAGDAITLAGDVLKGTTATGTTPVAAPRTYAGPLGPAVTLSATQRATAVASVATVDVTANATAFPEITLDVALLNHSGASVDGLDASSITVSENGKPVSSVTVLANAPGANRPRVYVAYDTSGSVAERWPSPAAQTAFEKQLAATLVAAAASVPFDVQVGGLGGFVNDAKWAPPVDGVLLSAFANADTDSTVWGTLGGDAIDEGVTAIVMVSDFQALDDPSAIPADQHRLAGAGIPVICMPIGQTDQATMAKIIAESGGSRLDPTAPDTPTALAALIKPVVADHARNTYRIRYPAVAGSPTRRTVTVGLHGRSTPTGTAAYTVPTAPVAPASFAGLYVTITVGNLYSDVRHLAGVQMLHGDPVGDMADPAAVAETRAAIFGLTTIAIEPGSVSTGALVDDMLASMQSIEPLSALPATATASQVLDVAGKKGIRRVPALLALLLEPPPAQKNPLALASMRVAILQERASSGGGIEQHMDLPPELNTIEPIGGDAAGSFAAAITLSTRAAAVEGATFADSAFSRLTGTALTVLAAGDGNAVDAFLKTVPSAQQTAWQTVLGTYSAVHILAPKGAVAAAMWVVDPNSGATSAVLLDGSGGALTVAAACPPATDGEKLMVIINGLLTLGNLVCVFTPVPYFCMGVTVANIAILTTAILSSPLGAMVGLPSTLVGIPLRVGGRVPFVPITYFGKSFSVILLLASWIVSSASTLCLGPFAY